ncbi:MAG: putative Aminotransferase [Nitrospira sp.]|nr:putative Aminotransferase [Nitrospira sp.]
MKAQRTLPPSAAPIDWRDLTLSLGGLLRPGATIRQREAEFRNYFGVKYVWFVSSGKAALMLILQALHGLSTRRKVIVPGYTCFSVPSAVLRAQLEVMLCDVDSRSFDFDFDQLTRIADSEVLCVLATHLLGFGVDVPRIVELCRQRGIFVVEDVAQALGGDREGKPFGTMGDVAFLSFGRGKNISCGSGGAILSNDDRIGEAITRYHTQLPEESILGMLKNWLEVVATQLLINPSCYWIPTGLPFLKLGETKFYKDFPVARMDSVRAGLLRGWKDRLAHATAIRTAHAQVTLESVGASSAQAIKPYPRGRSVYLRLPLLMRSKQEKEALCRVSSEEGLGVSSMYPSSIQHIAELRERLSSQHVPQSTMLAERLVTLPTHEFLAPRDLQRICRAIEDVQQGDGLKPACSSCAPEEQHRISELPRVN